MGYSADRTKHIGIQITPELHEKLKAMSEFEGRSISGEILYLIRQAILQYEKDIKELEKTD